MAKEKKGAKFGRWSRCPSNKQYVQFRGPRNKRLKARTCAQGSRASAQEVGGQVEQAA